MELATQGRSVLIKGGRHLGVVQLGKLYPCPTKLKVFWEGPLSHYLISELIQSIKLTVRAWFSRFGVCCVFILSSEGTVSQNCTYIRNPDYPSPYGQTSTIRYTITKCSPGKVGCKLPILFCLFFLNMKIFRGLRHQVRLRELHLGWDHWHHRNQWRNLHGYVYNLGKLEIFLLIISKNENAKWKIHFWQTSASSTIPTICGQNTGQHSELHFFHDWNSIAIFLTVLVDSMLFLYFSVCWYGRTFVWHCDPQLWFFWQFKYQAVGYQSHPSALQWKGKASS